MGHSVTIAPIADALTFARLNAASGGKVLAVTSYQNGRVAGVDLSFLREAPAEDAIDLLNRLGHDALEAAIATGKAKIEVDATELDVPVNLSQTHIAVGTNYPEHARESAVNIRPFLFPKYVQPTSAQAEIPAGDGLLDYEVELCLVPLAPLGAEQGAVGGLILGNDVTDRAALLRNVDLRDPQSGKGFTTGKSSPGFLPVGDLFIVPRDLDHFIAGLELKLSVNGISRQSGPVTDWIWDFAEILKQAHAKRHVKWQWREGISQLAFTDSGAIPARTLIMAGTPAGTIFQGVPKGDRIVGLLQWLLTGCRRPLLKQVIERYISRSTSRRTYLQKGDLVTICVDRLGMLSNRIV